MRFCFRFSMVFFLVAVGFTLIVRGDARLVAAKVIQSGEGIFNALAQPFTALIAIGLCLAPLARRQTRRMTAADLGLAVATLATFFPAFFLIKTALPILSEAAWGEPFPADRALIEIDDFVPLSEALRRSGMADTAVGWQQEWLWSFYANGDQGIGTGISAFPSGHLALATILVLYSVERGRTATAVAVLFLVVTLLLSVHTGYHYAVYGYVSMVAVWLLDKALRGLRSLSAA